MAKVFLSWSHADEQLKKDLLLRLEPNLAILQGVDFEWWEDSQILIGDAWRQSLLTRISECCYGLLLLSPSFFASKFITEEELPHFVGLRASASPLPVMLRAVPLDGSRALHGVDSTQIFTDAGKSYADLTGRARDRFARNLATAILHRIQEREWRQL